MTSRQRRAGSVLSWLGVAALLAGCGSGDDANANQDGQFGGAISELRSAAPRVVAGQAEAAAAAQGERDLAFSLLQAVDGEQNLVFSPHSLSAAFAMLTDAAEGQTLAEIEQTMHFGSVNEAFHRSQDALHLALAARNRDELASEDATVDAQILRESNDIWIRRDAEPDSSYLDTLARYYGAGVHQADFGTQPAAVRLAINAKVATDTNALIPELLPPGSISVRTIAALTNALYFKAPWATSFAAPVPGDFHALDGSTAPADMLRQTAEYPYFAGEGFVSVAVPYYGNELELLLIVPDAGQYAAVRRALSSDLLTQLTNARATENVDLTLPQLDLESTLPATETLQAMGMSTPFDAEAAQFPKLRRELANNVFIASVFHQATVAIDEKGTEASAATAIVADVRLSIAEPPPEPKVITVDRPFLFMIRDNPTGSVLFVGQVVAP